MTSVKKVTLLISVAALMLGLTGCSETGMLRNREFDYTNQTVTQNPLPKTPTGFTAPDFSVNYTIPKGQDTYKPHGRPDMTPPGFTKKVAVSPKSTENAQSGTSSVTKSNPKLQNKPEAVALTPADKASNLHIVPHAHPASSTQSILTTEQLKPIRSHLQRDQGGAGILVIDGTESEVLKRVNQILDGTGFKVSSTDSSSGYIFIQPQEDKAQSAVDLLYLQKDQDKLMLSFYDGNGQQDTTEQGFQLLKAIQTNLAK